MDDTKNTENQTSAPEIDASLEKWWTAAQRRDGTPLDDRALINYLFALAHQSGMAGMDGLYGLLHIAACAAAKLAGISPETLDEIHSDTESERTVLFEVYRNMLIELGVVTVESEEELHAVLKAMQEKPDKDKLN